MKRWLVTFVQAIVVVTGWTFFMIALGAVLHFTWAMFGIGWEKSVPDGWEGW